MINFPRAIDDPRQLPELRQALLEFASEDNGAWLRWEETRALHAIQGAVGYGPDELPKVLQNAIDRSHNTIEWYRSHLRQAQLIYVTPEMMEVVQASAATVPDDYVIEPLHLPTPDGLVVFGTPYEGVDSENGGMMRLDAIQWGPVRLPPRESLWTLADPEEDFVVPAVTMAAYRLMTPDMTDRIATAWYEGNVIPRVPFWTPLGRSEWPFGDRLTQTINTQVEFDSWQWKSMMDDRRLCAALWAILKQKMLTETHEVHPDRAARRRIERKGGNTSPVKVVHLRRNEYRPTASHGGSRLTTRHVVSPHFKLQPCGPNRSERKLILVPPYVRGPKDAPLQHTERVWSLDR